MRSSFKCAICGKIPNVFLIHLRNGKKTVRCGKCRKVTRRLLIPRGC